ncbi:MAG: hypothetical protein GX316_02055, partial [Firmicutes bacterium]|nr:hypothetical protein [Bacillota bacterium]
MFSKMKLYYHTVRYLRPVQIYHRVVRHIRPGLTRRINYRTGKFILPKIFVPELDLKAEYLKRFDVEELLHSKVRLLSKGLRLKPGQWHYPELLPFESFNLHYMEYLIPLAVAYHNTGEAKYYRKFKQIVVDWMQTNTDCKGNGWHPYTISMRIPNILICLDLFRPILSEDSRFLREVTDSIFSQYRYLLCNQELHLLGNHYFENLKTIVLCSISFGDEILYEKYIKRLEKELQEQILEDGLHFELSLTYHKLVLEGLIRLGVCLQHMRPTDVFFLVPTIQRMVDILASLEKGMGKTPLFNDAGDGVAKEANQLLDAARDILDIEPVYQDYFPVSGYQKLYHDNVAVMFDTGRLGPYYMTGHSHCDALSFELAIDERPVFVNSGTYHYQTELRSFFRST